MRCKGWVGLRRCLRVLMRPSPKTRHHHQTMPLTSSAQFVLWTRKEKHFRFSLSHLVTSTRRFHLLRSGASEPEAEQFCAAGTGGLPVSELQDALQLGQVPLQRPAILSGLDHGPHADRNKLDTDTLLLCAQD